MKFDFEEARAIVEAAKSRGAIRVAGSGPAPAASASKSKEEPVKGAPLPDWLQEGISAPSSADKPMSPEWRD
jgi:hypothetical protein